jgi:hypothetical protein
MTAGLKAKIVAKSNDEYLLYLNLFKTKCITAKFKNKKIPIVKLNATNILSVIAFETKNTVD